MGPAASAGAVSAANSLVGSTAGDQVGSDGVTALSNGNYVVSSPTGTTAPSPMPGRSAGGLESSGAHGSISSANSVRGLAASGGTYMVFQYDASNRQLVVGRPLDNIVTLFKLDSVTCQSCANRTTGARHFRSAAACLAPATPYPSPCLPPLAPIT